MRSEEGGRPERLWDASCLLLGADRVRRPRGQAAVTSKWGGQMWNRRRTQGVWGTAAVPRNRGEGRAGSCLHAPIWAVMVLFLFTLSGCGWSRATNTGSSEPLPSTSGAVSSVSSSPPAPSGAPWPTFGYDMRRSGLSPHLGPEQPELLWQVAYGEYEDSSPMVASDGTIYVGSSMTATRDTAALHALKPDGSLLWEFATNGDEAAPSPTIAPDGTIYVGSWDGTPANGHLYALGPDGVLRWDLELGDLVDAAVAPDGTIYTLDTGAGRLYAVDPAGSIRWQCETGATVYQSPLALGPTGTLYFGGATGLGYDYQAMVFAVAPDGRPAWRFEPQGAPEGQHLGFPVVAADGTIYVIGDGPAALGDSGESTLYALDADGKERWRYRFSGMVPGGNPSIGPDGAVYFACAGTVYAVDSQGNEKWRLATSYDVYTKPAIDADGTLYFVGVDGLVAVSADGTVKYHVDGPASHFSSVAIGREGRLYLTGNTGLAAFGERR